MIDVTVKALPRQKSLTEQLEPLRQRRRRLQPVRESQDLVCGDVGLRLAPIQEEDAAPDSAAVMVDGGLDQAAAPVIRRSIHLDKRIAGGLVESLFGWGSWGINLRTSTATTSSSWTTSLPSL